MTPGEPLSIVYVLRSGPWRGPGFRPAAVRALEEAGHRVEMAEDRPELPGPDAVLVVHGNANWFPGICAALERTPPERRPFTVIRHFEPLPPPASAGLPPRRRHLRETVKAGLRHRRATDPATNLARLRRLHAHGIPDVLFVASELWREGLAERGIPAEVLFDGGSADLGRDLGLERDVDVLFLGARDVPRRNRLLDRMRAEGVDVTVTGGWGRTGVWGEERTRLINRAKVFLHVVRHPGDLAELRFAVGMVNGACVLSETVLRPDPYVAGEHFAMAPPDGLADAARALLADDAERKRIARAGHELVTTHVTAERSAERLLEVVGERRGAPWATAR